MEAKVTLLGGAKIDGNAALVETPQTTFIIDYGMLMEEDLSVSSIRVHKIPERVEKIDFCLVTHAHLDHSGGIVELLKKYPACSVVYSPPTHIFSQMLLGDAYRRINEKAEIPSNRINQVDSNKKYKLVRGINVKFIPNGHCRGSGSVVLEIEVDSKKIVIMFSGDLSDQDLSMVAGFKTEDFSGINPDILFLESTYGNQIFPPRETEEKRLVKEIREVISSGGNVLIPAFSFGRAQDVAQMLARAAGIRTFIDGMAAAMTRQMREKMLLWGNDRVFEYQEEIRFAQSRRVTMEGNQKIVKKLDSFDKIINGGGNVVVTSSGWLQGGRSTRYLMYWLVGHKNAVFFPGPFQKYAAAELLKSEVGEITIPDPEDRNPDVMLKRHITLRKNARVERFILSSHADQKGLLKFTEIVKPKKIILYHGDEDAKISIEQKLVCPTEISESGQEIVL